MILVIDNYDSFTYNLVQLIGSLGPEVVVRQNDGITVAEIVDLDPAGVVLSPGPGGPADAGICLETVRRLGGTTPILGVCLGHQVIAAAYGARVRRARRPMHGKTSPVHHTGTGIFRDIPDPVVMTRYHSLTVDPATMPDELEVTAWTGEAGWKDELQGLAHRSDPVWGVQFHPESAASHHGERIVANFLEATR
jgi:anthranilate synthase/aminodeoxychorismate synthase-like glutamine amidotransferase